MKIAIGSDHAGFELKTQLKPFVESLGAEVLDIGAFDAVASDYPDFAVKVGEAILSGQAERGILICGSGVGVSVAASKIPGIRAAICHDTYSAHQGVEHDDMNVLVIGSRIIAGELAKDIIRAYLPARFTGEARHVRRLAKVHAIETRYSKPTGS